MVFIFSWEGGGMKQWVGLMLFFYPAFFWHQDISFWLDAVLKANFVFKYFS